MIEKIKTKIDAAINNPDADLKTLAEYIFANIKANNELTRPLVKLLFEKFGPDNAAKVVNLILENQRQHSERLTIHRSAQFDVSNILKG